MYVDEMFITILNIVSHYQEKGKGLVYVCVV